VQMIIFRKHRMTPVSSWKHRMNNFLYIIYIDALCVWR
jgi:hypothetical protein